MRTSNLFMFIGGLDLMNGWCCLACMRGVPIQPSSEWMYRFLGMEGNIYLFRFDLSNINYLWSSQSMKQPNTIPPSVYTTYSYPWSIRVIYQDGKKGEWYKIIILMFYPQRKRCLLWEDIDIEHITCRGTIKTSLSSAFHTIDGMRRKNVISSFSLHFLHTS